jgi:hypothetical protein
MRTPVGGAIGAAAIGRPRAARRGAWVDPLLRGTVIAWGLGCLLPIPVWTGVAAGDAFAHEMILRFWGLVIAGLATLLCLALTRARCAAWLRAGFAALLTTPRGAYLIALGLLAAAESVAVATLSFARNPQLIDTWAQYIQARSFAAGLLTAAPPPASLHFGLLQMLTTPAGGWIAQYPPLHPALLAVGMALGAPWLVTPLLAALLPAAVYALGRRSGDERVARLAALLVLLSPFAIAMNASAMNHLPAALGIATGLALLPAAARGETRAAALAGLVAGVTLGIRPLDAVALVVVGAAALLVPISHRVIRPAIAAALGAAIGALPTLWFNALTTGSALRFGYTALYGAGHSLGFHSGPWGEPLTPLRAVGLTAADADQLNTYLFEWPLPVTVLIVAALADRRGLDAGRRTAAAYLAVLVGLLFFYFHRDLLYGPRFLFSALPAICVLVAAGIVRLAAIDRRLPRLDATLGDAAVVLVTVVAVQGAVWLGPQRLASYSAAGSVLALQPAHDAERAALNHAVVVLRDGFGTRLIARMWDAGVPVVVSGRLYAAFDACTLDELLRQAEAQGLRDAALVEHLQAAAAGASPGRPIPGVTPDPLLRLPVDGRLSPSCAAEIDWDRAGIMQYAAVAHLNTPGFDGNVVWAREMPDLSTLRRLYPDRPIYRYTPSGTFTLIAP